jgi:hypothetical protein
MALLALASLPRRCPSAVRVGRENLHYGNDAFEYTIFARRAYENKEKTVFRLLVADMDASQEESIKLLLERLLTQ